MHVIPCQQTATAAGCKCFSDLISPLFIFSCSRRNNRNQTCKERQNNSWEKNTTWTYIPGQICCLHNLRDTANHIVNISKKYEIWTWLQYEFTHGRRNRHMSNYTRFLELEAKEQGKVYNWQIYGLISMNGNMTCKEFQPNIYSHEYDPCCRKAWVWWEWNMWKWAPKVNWEDGVSGCASVLKKAISPDRIAQTKHTYPSSVLLTAILQSKNKHQQPKIISVCDHCTQLSTQFQTTKSRISER